MKKIAKYIKIGTREAIKTRINPATYDEHGNELTPAYTEQYTEYVPVMGTITRDMTPEEEAELAAQAVGMPAPEQTDAERIASLEQQIALLLGGDTN